MTKASLQLEYVASDQLALQPDAWWGTVLGIAGFAWPPPIRAAGVPIAASAIPPLRATGDVCEVWRMREGRAVESASAPFHAGCLNYRWCEDSLFGSITLDESAFAGSGSMALSCATTAAYGIMFRVLEDMPQRHLVRVWNYLPEINRDVDGEERYRHFNAARQAAFRASGRGTEGSVPAACALGSPAGSPICIYFLASCRPPSMIENPRQMSAYFYPPQYGAASPTFSRACLLPGAAGVSLFVSGTASIVGHTTLHAGDVAAQTRETLANIDALLNQANRVSECAGDGRGSGQDGPARCGARYALDEMKFKVYVRHATDFIAVENALMRALRPLSPVVYLQADICRAELLVEIEAVGGSC